jgi:hypothetical protein
MLHVARIALAGFAGSWHRHGHTMGRAASGLVPQIAANPTQNFGVFFVADGFRHQEI